MWPFICREKPCWIVGDARLFYRFLCVQVNAVIASSTTILAFMPSMKDYIDPTLFKSIMLGLAVCNVLAIIARVKKQPALDDKKRELWENGKIPERRQENLSPSTQEDKQ